MRVSRRQLVQGVGLAGLGLVAGCGRWPGQAQPPAKAYRVGYIGNPDFMEAFREGLREHGWVEGQNIVIESRASPSRQDLPTDRLAAELVALPVDVIVTQGTPPTLAAMQATSSIPIVMAISVDPVGEGHVASLARPGGHVTGQSVMTRELSGKRLELLQDAVPGISRVAVLWAPADPGMGPTFAEVEAAARRLGVDLQSLEVAGPEDFDRAFAVAAAEHADALLVLPTGFILRGRQRIVELAAAHRLPAMYPYREHVEAGGLMNYGPNVRDMFRRAATYVDKILKGAKPADLPVEQPMTFSLVINAKTAQALGLTIPPHVLLQATEVLQ
jgi:putative tryptophan/tyrosine transport system substrate-binding protein